MMVTFVSQCEKNALKKTRRVLDAFANRIGDNTWQTIITQDGLDTVKKMLRSNASKSTAVSCHWIRSRSRSQFLWVVGNKKKFNNQGYVAVNWTEVNDIKMDETEIMNEEVYANTHKQLLVDHLYAVGSLAQELVKKLIDDKNLQQIAFYAGCLHDVGKLDPKFKGWLDEKISQAKTNEVELTEDGVHVDKGNFSFEKHPRHNEVTLWLLQFTNLSELLSNRKLQPLIEHAVYWHHAKPIRKEEYENLNHIHKKLKAAYKGKGIKELCEHANLILKEVSELAKPEDNMVLNSLKFSFDEETVLDFRKTLLPEYKQYDVAEEIDDYQGQVSINAKSNIIRTCVISADRAISQLSNMQLQSVLDNSGIEQLANKLVKNESSLIQHISSCLEGFNVNYPNSERNVEQSRTANSLLDAESLAVLNGPAGCGKTKIALEWAKLSDAQKIIWVCPRVQVCEGLFKDLTSAEYLPKANIEICTGEIKEQSQNGKITITQEGQEFSGDIVLTTIDQIISGITTHTKATALVEFMNAHIVFDEYHEYIPMSAFNLLFAELVKCKQLKGDNANTLLVSATPNYFFVQQFLAIDDEDILDCNSFNESEYQMEFQPFDEEIFDKNNPLFAKQSSDTIVISNTATTAQLSYIANQSEENAIVFHGKFKVSDKKLIFDQVFQSFRRDGTKRYDVLRSGPIVQASLNITCKKMVTEFTVAENWLQRLGRLDRFGESKAVNYYITAVPQSIIESNGKIKGSCARFLNGSNVYRSSYAWYQFLQGKELNSTVTINQVYQLYKEFYQSDKALESIEQDLVAALKESVKVICAKVHDPVRFIPKQTVKTKKKLKKSSLRGDSRFVQMAKLQVNGKDSFEVLEEYAINWQEADTDFTNCYTESLERIRSSGLIDYAAKKQERITPNSPVKGIPASKIGLRKQVLEGSAVEPENPIYLSYTPIDLSECLGEKKSDPAAIYYVVCDKQIIGAMPLDKLTK